LAFSCSVSGDVKFREEFEVQVYPSALDCMYFGVLGRLDFDFNCSQRIYYFFLLSTFPKLS
jgi:hypothetical protein